MKPTTVNLFGQKVPVNEYGIIDWSKVRIPRINVPEGKNILDLLKEV